MLIYTFCILQAAHLLWTGKPDYKIPNRNTLDMWEDGGNYFANIVAELALWS